MHDAIKTLERLGMPRALVVGDLMLDRYTWGDATRVSPEGPVLVLRSDLDEVRPGGAASVAYLLAGLDAQVSVSGVVGRDADGRTVRRLLDEAKISHVLAIDDDERVTTCKQRIVGRAANHPHQLVRVDREDDRPIGRAVEQRLVAVIRERLPEFDVLLVSDYAKGVCTRRLLASVIAAAADLRIPALVDPARGADYERYRGASLLKPNRLEAQIASGVRIRCACDALTAGRLLREQSRVESVLITLDAEGMALIPAGGKGKLIATRPRNVHDVTGAGDMALAMLGVARAAGIGWLDAARLANVSAGLEVEKIGISPITREEIRAALRLEDGLPSPSPFDYDALSRPSVENALRRVPQTAVAPRLRVQPGEGRAEGVRSGPAAPEVSRLPLRKSKIISLNELLSRLQGHRREGQTIVFTNGCFDLFHVGHLRCLEEAAALGDVLVVALNSDASVGRLKGPGRPVVRQQDRAEIIAALHCVDYVVVFGADTPHKLLRAIQPHVLAKGGTSPSDSVAGRELVAGHGGQVRVTGRVHGVSTTRILEQIKTRGRK